MRLLLIILLFTSVRGFATNYYVDDVLGLDANNGLSAGTAVATITKVNSMFSGFAPGDSILFKRGGVWYGRINIGKSGTAGSRIVLGAYGTGSNPVINGFSIATWFVNTGGNIWESGGFGNTNIPNIVTVNGVIKVKGRYPNSGYGTYSTFDAGSITDAGLSPFTLTGATACIRKLHDILSNDPITGQSGGQITVTSTSGYVTKAGYGYFVQDALGLCDIQDEWYFNNTTKKLSIFSTTSPTGIKVSVIDTLLYIAAYDYITISNIDFEGANIAAITGGGPTVGQSVGITITGCKFTNCGRNAVYMSNASTWLIDNNQFQYCQNNAVYGENEGGRSVNMTLTNNTVKNIGVWPGMGYVNSPTSQNISHNGFTIIGENLTCQYNSFDTLGHCAVAAYYSNNKVKNNFIRRYCEYFGDAGGINFFDISGGTNTETGIEISGNILVEAGEKDYIGTGDGINNVMGIYLDDKINNGYIYQNFIAQGTRHGVYGHNVTGMIVRENTIYDSWEASYSIRHDDHAYGIAQVGNMFVSNICAQLAPTYGAGLLKKDRRYIYLANSIDGNNIDSMFVNLDSNFYSRKASAGDTTFTVQKAVMQYRNFTTWKSNYASTPFGGAWDANSTNNVLSSAEVIYKYNATINPVTIDLGLFNWLGVKGENYPGTITLAPYTGAILTKGSAIDPLIPPVANAGADQTIVLPINYVSLSSAGTTGIISSYSWTKVIGTGSIISTPSGTNTTVTGLTQGVYLFRLTVTDVNTLTDTDDVQITVNPAVVPPTPTSAHKIYGWRFIGN